MEVLLPENCTECDSSNLKITGTRISGRVQIEVRCLRCGEVLWKNVKD
ncbi:MAG: hypothetical protein ACLFVP_10170 [Candidatus Bathyarchaeia archaeon]